MSEQADMSDVVAINEQKVVELGLRVKQLERANVQLLIEKLANEKMAMDNATAYMRERAPHLQREMEEAQTRLMEMSKNAH